MRKFFIIIGLGAFGFWLFFYLLNSVVSFEQPASRSAPVDSHPEPEKSLEAVRGVEAKGTKPMEAVRAPKPMSANVVSWSSRRDSILSMNITSDSKADLLFKALPELNAEEQEEAVKHLINLLNESDYASLQGWFTSTNTPPKIQQALMADLLNRPDKTKLPICLAVASTPSHPLIEDALKVLKLYAPQDYGTNWSEWEVFVQSYLTNNGNALR